MKSLLRFLPLLIVWLLLLELFSFTLIYFGTGRLTFLTVQKSETESGEPQDAIQEGKSARGAARYVPHPYYGYTFEPGYRFTGRVRPRTLVANSQGFLGDEHPSGADKSVYNVFITGGSVARNFFINEQEQLEKRLASLINESSEAAGEQNATKKKVRVYSLAQGGWKQPQQLNAVSQLLLQGSQIDLLINIDGYNEVAHVFANYKIRRLTPIYPVFWKEQMRRRLSSASKLLIGEIQMIKNVEEIISSIGSNSTLAHSQTIRLLSLAGQSYLEKRRMRTEAALQSSQDDESFAATGKVENLSEKQLGQVAIDIWAEASEQIASLSKGRFSYLHVLQPHQYYGKKTLTSRERESAYDPEHTRSKAVAEFYPEMRKRFAALAVSPNQRLDASVLFDDEERTVFIDTCCHFNLVGHEALLNQILEAIKKQN